MTYSASWTLAQSAEGANLPIFSFQPFTANAGPYQVQLQSFANTGAGAGTYNHGVWIGWNSSRHAAGQSSATPTILMGIEDNYFDDGGDNSFGTEWYVEGWSPDGITIQMSRPYYARGQQTNAGMDSWQIVSNLGASGPNRQFAIKAGTASVVSVYPSSAVVRVPSTFTSTIEGVGGVIVGNGKWVQLRTANGGICSAMGAGTDNTLYIGDIFGQSAKPVNLRAGGKNVAALTPDGCLHIPAVSGPPTVPPQVQPGMVALCFDTTTDRLFAFNGAWKSVQLFP